MSDIALPRGQNRDRLRLWDNQWLLLYDSATATTPAYKHIPTWCNATIDHPDGTRWSGRFTRTRLGIVRDSYDVEYLNYLLEWPTFPQECAVFPLAAPQ